jgi:hypothetical protein
MTMRCYPCEVCGEPATIHETAIEGGVVSRRHSCEVHGKESLLVPEVKSDDAGFQAMVDYYRGLSEAEKDEMAVEYRLLRRVT